MKKPILKAYYGGIFFEFILQDRIADAVIILPGFPGRNDYNELIEFFLIGGIMSLFPVIGEAIRALEIFYPRIQ